MKMLILSIAIFSYLSCLSQKQQGIYLNGSYQVYSKNSIYAGISLHKKLIWPTGKYDYYMFQSLYFERYLSPSLDKKINSIGYSWGFGLSYVYLGTSCRYVFQGKSYRLDFAPLIRIGYKYLWIEYSRHFLVGDNPFSDNQIRIVDLNKKEDNIKLILTIPILKK